MAKGIEINFMENKIVVTEAFAKKAGKMGTVEYNEMLKLRRELPDFEMVLAEKKEKKANKNKNLDYKHMKEYIKEVSATEEEAKAIIDELEARRELSKMSSNPYKVVLDWFLAKYPEVRKLKEKENKKEKEAA